MNPKIEKLIKMFAKLPRVGGRAAGRIVLALLQDKTGRAAALGAALLDAAETIRPCTNCGCLTDNGACVYCRDASRGNGQICVVRDLGDVWTIEKAGVFGGRYHILGGLISGCMGTTPDDLNITSLTARIEPEEIREIIFVLPNTVEGKTTQHYVMSMIQSSKFRVQSSDNKDKNINNKTVANGDASSEICTLNSALSFTELASGVPLGGDLDYIDDGTLSLAFGRREKI